MANWQLALARRDLKSLLMIMQKTDVDLKRSVLRAAKEAEKIVATIPENNVGAVIRRAMYRHRRSALYDIAKDLWGNQISRSTMSGLSDAMALASLSHEQLLAVLTRSVGTRSASVLAQSMMASARGTFSALIARAINDVNLSVSVYKNTALMIGKVDRVVNNGLLLGQSAREIASGVAQYISPSVSGGVQYAANRLARTEINNAYHSANREMYKQSPYVIEVDWNLSAVHEHPDECDILADGSPYQKGHVPDKPHPNCFCFISPSTQSSTQFNQDLRQGRYDCVAA